MKYNVRLALIIGFWLALAIPAHAATSSAVSNITTVDTRDNLITVSGRVRDAKTEAPLANASISLAGQNITTAVDGSFSLANISLSSGNILAATKTGYAMGSQAVNAPPGSKSIALPDIFLQTSGNKPIITKLEGRLRGVFLSGASLENDFTASANWNGWTPGYVRFLANETQIADKTGSGPNYVCAIDMAGSYFRPAFNPSANKIKAIAVSSGGQSSDPFTAYVGIVPMPVVC